VLSAITCGGELPFIELGSQEAYKQVVWL